MFTHLTVTEVVGKGHTFPQSKSGAALITTNLTIINGKYGCTYIVLQNFMYYLKIRLMLFFYQVLSFQAHLSLGL